MSIGFYGRDVSSTGFPHGLARMKSVRRLVCGSITIFNFTTKNIYRPNSGNHLNLPSSWRLDREWEKNVYIQFPTGIVKNESVETCYIRNYGSC